MKNKAFTLIELLVVISIIGILAALAMVSFTGPQRQARDAGRKSDLRQYSTALEGYANKNNSLYPVYSAVRASTVVCPILGLTTCSEDPKYSSDNTYVYKYQSDGTYYVLWGKLENVTKTWVVCSTGQVGEVASFSGGTCPL